MSVPDPRCPTCQARYTCGHCRWMSPLYLRCDLPGAKVISVGPETPACPGGFDAKSTSPTSPRAEGEKCNKGGCTFVPGHDGEHSQNRVSWTLPVPPTKPCSCGLLNLTLDTESFYAASDMRHSFSSCLVPVVAPPPADAAGRCPVCPEKAPHGELPLALGKRTARDLAFAVAAAVGTGMFPEEEAAAVALIESDRERVRGEEREACAKVAGDVRKTCPPTWTDLTVWGEGYVTACERIADAIRSLSRAGRKDGER